MSKTRILILLALAVGLTGWLTMRRSPAAVAGEPVASFGENTEEIALKRWQGGEARHWRQVVTRH